MPSILKTTQIQEPSSASVNLTLDTSGNATSAGTVVMSSPYTMRNKIINGAMVIDQRNAGASVTQSTANAYGIDRWLISGSVASKFTAQRSTTAPTGFSNSMLVTSSSAYTVGAGDFFYVMQGIEGLNCADLAFGTASAQTVTLSFWVRSSLTGSFGGALRNLIAGATRSYPFTYTISSANTWEQKTVTITGDTTGTWATDNTNSVTVCFGLGTGSTYSGTSGAWAGANVIQPTSTTSVVGTNGATFYITGVQLERGTVATPFEYRNYQQELAMCQRYAYRLPSTSNSAGIIATVQGATTVLSYPQNPVPMRSAPSVTFSATWNFSVSGGDVAITALNANTTDTNSIQIEATVSGQTTGQAGRIRSGYYIASAEL